MSALSTPGGGGNTAQSKPASGKQKYQKLDINSLYCANRNENSEPSSVKSQLSRKHGMQSLGKVPSARRPPANLPSLKTETGQDPNANSISATTTTVSTPATCSSQTITTSVSSSAVAGAAAGGWVSLPPPSSPHFRTEFPSLEAAAQPSHRSTEHSQPQLQLRPQTEGSWTCGGAAGGAGGAAGAGGSVGAGGAGAAGGGRAEPAGSPGAAPASSPAAQQTPAFRAILPSFLMKGSSGGGIGLGSLGSVRDARGGGGGGSGGGTGGGGGGGGSSPSGRPAPRAPAPPRAVEVLTARPILRDEQISSLDDIRDAGWAQNDDIDYNQKLDFSDGESSAPNKASNKNNNRSSIEHERIESKLLEPGDEEQLWAERRQKQNNEVAAAVARARQRKEEEQRRQMRDHHKQDDNRDARDNRDHRDKDSRDRNDNRDRFENRDRDKDNRDRMDNRDRQDQDKGRMETRDRDRNDNRERGDRERFDRDRGDRERDRPDRGDRDRGDRERDFRDRDRERDRDYGRDRNDRNDRNDNNPAFSKTFQANIPPRFLKQQQNRQQDDQHKPWAFTHDSHTHKAGGFTHDSHPHKAGAFPGKPAPPHPARRPDPPHPPQYAAPHRGSHAAPRRSYSRDYSDREDDFRRDSKDGSGPQWRSEMQDYERSGRELDRSNSKDSYKDYDHKDKRNESERKSSESNVEHSSSRTAADKLAEVFERKSRLLTEPFASSDSSVQTQPERRVTPPSGHAQRDSAERDLGKTSWADVTQDEPANYTILKSSSEKVNAPKEESPAKDLSQKVDPDNDEKRGSIGPPPQHVSSSMESVNNSQSQVHKASSGQNFTHNQQTSQVSSYANISSSQAQPSFSDNLPISKVQSEPLSKSHVPGENLSSIQKQPSAEHILTQSLTKPLFTSHKSEKEFSESESVASKSSTDPASLTGVKVNEIQSGESLHVVLDSQKRPDDKRNERFSNEQLNRIPGKEPIERKSSGSGSEKKGRGYGGGGGGYSVYVRGWGAREPRGRRAHRTSRSNNRASESDGSTDGAPNAERKERRRAPRSPRGPKKQDRPEDANRPANQAAPAPDAVENREPFAPRGQPSRRGRGGFQGTSRPPAPAKRVTGYGPPNTKSPFSQANRVKENEDVKDGQPGEDKGKAGNKPRTGSQSGRGRDRRAKGIGGPLSGEDENWETTSEHSEGGGTGGRRRSVGGRQGQSQKGQGRNHNAGNRQNAPRNAQGAKKDAVGENKTAEVTEAIGDLKLSSKKVDEAVDDGFQEVRNKKNSKDTRGPSKEDSQNAAKQPRSHSNQGGNRNGSTTRNPNEKPNSRGSAPVPGKSGSQYERPRQANLAPRFVKQRQKQQMGIVTGFAPDTGGAPPPPPVNAWDKPISQTLRGNVDDSAELPDNKSGQSSQRSTPADAPSDAKPAPATCALNTDKVGVLDGTTPPVETIIFENTNYKTAPPAEALKPKYQPGVNAVKTQGEEISQEVDARPLPFNGEVQPRPRSIRELIGDNGRPADSENALSGLQMPFDTSQKAEDSSDMKLDFAFDSDLGQLTEDKTAKSLGLPRTHMSTSNTISPLAADLNLKIASVKKVWEMPAVAEGGEELQFAGFEESNTETGAPPNVCKVKPTQQLQSPPPQHYNHVGYQGGYGGLSVPSPPAVLFNSSQQLLGSSQQQLQQGGLYGAFLDQSRTQFGGFPGTPYGANYNNYQPPPDMFQNLPSQYRMAAAAAAGGGAAFGQSGQLGNSPSTVLISSSSNSLMSATVKPSNQQIGAIGSKGGGVGGVGGVGSVNTYQQQYLGYSGPVGDAPYSLQGLLPRGAPPASSYYSPYGVGAGAAPAPTYPLQFTPPAQSGFNSQFLSSQLQVAAAAAVQQMQQYRAPMQQQYAPPPSRPPPQQQLKSPLHEHANGFAGQLGDAASPTPKGGKPGKPPHSPPHHKYHQPPPPPQHQHHNPHQQQMMGGGNNGRMGGGVSGGGGGGGGGQQRGGGGMLAPRYPAPIQRPHAPPPPLYRAPPPPRPHPHPHAHPHPHPHQQQARHNMYYHHHQRNGGGGGGGERAVEGGEGPAPVEEPGEGPAPGDAPLAPPAAEVPPE